MSSESERPPFVSEYTQRDLDRLTEILKQPADEAHGHGTIEVEQKFEEIAASPNSLSDEYTWFILGLAYCLIRIDRSLMEAYQYSLDHSIKLRTFQAARPLIEVNGSAQWSLNPWSGIIQDLEHQHATTFINYVESYQFNRADTKHSWRCVFERVELQDPFSQGPMKHSVWVAMPFNETLRRRLRTISPGLGSSPPLVGMVTEPKFPKSPYG